MLNVRKKNIMKKSIILTALLISTNIQAGEIGSAHRVMADFPEKSQQGAGTRISENSVATNCHILHHTKTGEAAESFKVFSIDGKTELNAKLTKQDFDHDICILEVDGLDGSVAKTSVTSEVTETDEVFVNGWGDRKTKGNMIERLKFKNGTSETILRIAGKCEKGYSGSGAYNPNGEFIGIVTWQLDEDKSCLIVPVELVNKLAQL